MDKGMKIRCLRNHEFTPENTFPRPDGRRECRACRRLHRTAARAGLTLNEYLLAQAGQQNKPALAPAIADPTSSDWRHQAACRELDGELFFPVGNTAAGLAQAEAAKAVCRDCPARLDCLAWALETGQDAGVWGGFSEDERRSLKRRAARTRIPALELAQMEQS